MKPIRKPAPESSPRRDLILDTTQRLILDEGYASVSTRRVAREAGLTSALVHYYYPTTDDLLLAIYSRAHERHLERLAKALISPRPIEALWSLHMDAEHTALGAELLAMGNHRKAISLEIAKNIEQSRMMQASALASVLETRQIDTAGLSALALITLMSGVSRAMVVEKAHGVSLGHAEIEAFVAGWARRFRAPPGPDAGQAHRPKTAK